MQKLAFILIAALAVLWTGCGDDSAILAPASPEPTPDEEMLVRLASDGRETFFGPVNALRVSEDGALPQKPTVTEFTILEGHLADFEPPFLLNVLNGDESGVGRGSNAWILVDGVQVFGPRDFSQQVEWVEREIDLAPGAVITVRVAGGPDARLRLSLSGVPKPVSGPGLLYYGPANGIYQLFVTYDLFETSTQLTFGDSESGKAAWSPDGSMVAYVHDRAIYVMDADGANNRFVASDESSSPAPIYSRLFWSNDGTEIIYHKSVSTQEDQIKAVNVETGAIRFVIDHPGDKDVEPAVNPANGSEIVYPFDYGNWTPNRELRIRNVDTGTDEIIVPRNGKADHMPSFSPDGTKVIWSESVYSYTGYHQLKVYDRATGAIHTIVDDANAVGGGAVWSKPDPNSDLVYYSYRRTSGYSVVGSVKIDGTDRTEILVSETNIGLWDVK